ncbi:MAG: DUF1836 domain-containing protein [Oscillospiraceae bacterium]
MQSNENRLEEILAQARGEACVHPGDIPGLDLYMDQIVTLFEEWLAFDKRGEQEKLLTKTMVNNYSKEGLIKPVKGKKYAKEHILQMLLIYHLKQSLSIQDIGRVFAGVRAQREETLDTAEELGALYERFITTNEMQWNALRGLLQEGFADCRTGSKEDLLFCILCMTALSHGLNRCSEQLIDHFFAQEKQPPGREKSAAKEKRAKS